MKLHANAALGPKGRATMVARVVDQGWSLAEAAEAAGVSERTCSKWVARFRAEGQAGRKQRSRSRVIAGVRFTPGPGHYPRSVRWATAQGATPESFGHWCPNPAELGRIGPNRAAPRPPR